MEAYTCRVKKFTMISPASIARECENAVATSYHFFADLTTLNYTVSLSGQTQTIQVEPVYTDAVEIMAYLEGKQQSISQENARTLEKARQVHAAIVNPQMSEYDQVKAFHDYLVNNTTYGGSSDRRFTAGGALVDVTGYAGGQSHAWNKVRVNGNWYNIDVTWDDPVSSRPMLLYDYFLISDAAIGRDHTQDNNPYWPAATANWPGR